VVPEKDGEDQLDRSWEKRKSFTHSQGGELYPTNIKKSEGRRTGLVTFCVGTAFIKHVIEGKIEGTLEVTGR
jgi:hypothetical protein